MLWRKKKSFLSGAKYSFNLPPEPEPSQDNEDESMEQSSEVNTANCATCNGEEDTAGKEEGKESADVAMAEN